MIIYRFEKKPRSGTLRLTGYASAVFISLSSFIFSKSEFCEESESSLALLLSCAAQVGEGAFAAPAHADAT